jgi:hypothetical protein
MLTPSGSRITKKSFPREVSLYENFFSPVLQKMTAKITFLKKSQLRACQAQYQVCRAFLRPTELTTIFRNLRQYILFTFFAAKS